MPKPPLSSVGLFAATVVLALGWLNEARLRREAERLLTATHVSVDSLQKFASQRDMELQESKALLTKSEQELNGVLSAFLGQTEYLEFPERAPPVRERLLELKKDLEQKPLMSGEELKRILSAPIAAPPSN